MRMRSQLKQMGLIRHPIFKDLPPRLVCSRKGLKNQATSGEQPQNKISSNRSFLMKSQNPKYGDRMNKSDHILDIDDPDSHVWTKFKADDANSYHSFKVKHSINGKFQSFSRQKSMRSASRMRSKSPAAMSMLDQAFGGLNLDGNQSAN